MGIFLLYEMKCYQAKKKKNSRGEKSEEIALMQQLCCSAWQRCWPPYRSVRRIKEAVLQMTEALAKS